jgi:HAD superfamily hydrolase (TIGR01509 family)
MISPGRPRAVVFDLDGTLMDSLALVLAALTHVLEPFGRRPTMDVFAHLGGPPDRFMADLLPPGADVATVLARFRDYHLAHSHRIAPYEGAPPLLRQLRAAGVPVAVWTGRDRQSTDWLFQRHGLRDELATSVCGDDLPSHKPDPAGLRKILDELGVPAAEALLVGDADVDVLGGAACGVRTLLIRHQRNIDPTVLTRCWRDVEGPDAAYAVVRAQFGLAD